MTKKRKLALVLAVVGFVALAVALVGFIINYLNMQAHFSGGVGIIGGADGPTATLSTRLWLFSTPFDLLLLGGIGCLITAAILAFTHK